MANDEDSKRWSLWEQPWFMLAGGVIWVIGAASDLRSSTGFSRFMDWLMLGFAILLGLYAARQLVRRRRGRDGQEEPSTR